MAGIINTIHPHDTPNPDGDPPLGYTPVNVAGDTMTGTLNSSITGTPGDSVNFFTISQPTGVTTVFDYAPLKHYIVSNVDQSTAAAGSHTSGLVVVHNGAGGSGTKNGAWVAYSHSQPTTTPFERGFYTGLFTTVSVDSGDGGTLGTPRGQFFGRGSIVTLKSTATHTLAVIGDEVDISTETGATAPFDKVVFQFAHVNSDALKGQTHDAFCMLVRDPTCNASGQADFGFVLGRAGTKWPVSGTIMGTYTTTDSMACVNGIDFSAITISGSAFKSPGFAVSGAGVITAGGALLVNSFAAYAALESAGGTGFRWITSSGSALMQRTTNGFTGATTPITVDTSDNVLFSGSAKSSSATAGIGYATGAGGTVTQATSKATGVTLNKICGQVTMNNAALAAGAKVSFVVTDSACAATDGPRVWVVSGGTANAYRADVTAVASGSFTITVENITAGSLSEAPVVGFSIGKAVTA